MRGPERGRRGYGLRVRERDPPLSRWRGWSDRESGGGRCELRTTCYRLATCYLLPSVGWGRCISPLILWYRAYHFFVELSIGKYDSRITQHSHLSPLLPHTTPTSYLLPATCYQLRTTGYGLSAERSTHSSLFRILPTTGYCLNMMSEDEW